jgi:hypothetical protein
MYVDMRRADGDVISVVGAITNVKNDAGHDNETQKGAEEVGLTFGV